MKTMEKSGEVISTARVTVRPENRRELCLTISALLEPIRREKGCRAYSFYGEVTDQNSLILIGEWDTVTAWENHVKSNHFAVLIGSLTLLSNRSNLDFNLLSHIAEIEPLGLVGCGSKPETQSRVSVK